jgi:hypothetical protein
MTKLTWLAVLALLAPAAAWTQPVAPQPPERLTSDGRFKCQDAPDLRAQFASRAGGLVAIVDAGDGPHALPLRPWDGGAVRITWSDGRRTLTWSPGVHLMWMDGAAHRMCGRAAHSH